jgi:hypothetical protein
VTDLYRSGQAAVIEVEAKSWALAEEAKTGGRKHEALGV